MLGIGLGITSTTILSAAKTRVIPTLSGTQYGTIDTAVTFTGDFEVEVEFASADTTSTMAFFGDVSGGTTNYCQVGGTNIVFLTDDGSVGWAHGGAHSDGKVRVFTLYRSGNTLGIKLDGVIKNTSTLGAASQVDIDLVGCLGIATVPSQFFIGQMLSTKFTNITTGVIRDFVFDSGSTTEQYARGSTTDKITLVNFAAGDWSRYTLQRNIAHDAGSVAEAWVGGNVVVNGGFDADTDWTKETGWSIGSGIASCDGTQVGNSDLWQDLSLVGAAIYLHSFDLQAISAGNIRAKVGGNTSGLLSSLGVHKSIIPDLGFTHTGLEADINFVGSVDNVSVQHLLEIA